MAQFVSKIRTALRGGAKQKLVLPPGVKVRVPDELVEEFLAAGNGHGRALKTAGVLAVLPDPKAPPAPAPASPGPVDATPRLMSLEALNAAKALDRIDGEDDIETLRTWLSAETAGKKRKGALEALADRIAELELDAEGEHGDDEASGD